MRSMAMELLRMARAVLALNDYQRGLVNEHAGQRGYLEYGIFGNGRNVFALPFTKNDIEPCDEIMDFLNEGGYEIGSYKDNVFYGKGDVSHRRILKFNTILRKSDMDAGRKDELNKLFAERMKSGMKDMTALECVITNDPEDVGGMSTDKTWTSCMRLPANESDNGGAFHMTALNEVKNGGMVAYLVEKGERDMDRALARIAIKRLVGKGGYIFLAEDVVYGMSEFAEMADFMGFVRRKLNESNGATCGKGGSFGMPDREVWSDSLRGEELYMPDGEKQKYLDMDDDEFNRMTRHMDEKMRTYLDSTRNYSKIKSVVLGCSPDRLEAFLNANCLDAYQRSDIVKMYFGTKVKSFGNDIGGLAGFLHDADVCGFKKLSMTSKAFRRQFVNSPKFRKMIDDMDDGTDIGMVMNEFNGISPELYDGVMKKWIDGKYGEVKNAQKIGDALRIIDGIYNDDARRMLMDRYLSEKHIKERIDRLDCRNFNMLLRRIDFIYPDSPTKKGVMESLRNSGYESMVDGFSTVNDIANDLDGVPMWGTAECKMSWYESSGVEVFSSLMESGKKAFIKSMESLEHAHPNAVDFLSCRYLLANGCDFSGGDVLDSAQICGMSPTYLKKHKDKILHDLGDFGGEFAGIFGSDRGRKVKKSILDGIARGNNNDDD